MVASSNLVIPTNNAETLGNTSVSVKKKGSTGTAPGQMFETLFLDEPEQNPDSSKKKMHLIQKTKLHAIINYRPAKLTVGKEWYVSFYAFDPVLCQLRRRKIKVNHIQPIATRRIYANEIIKKVNEKLLGGWSPFIESESSNAYKSVEDVFAHFRKLLTRQLNSAIIRAETYTSYSSYLKIFEEYALKIKPIKYIYQIDRLYMLSFLEYVYIERGNSAQTRDNYLGWLRVLSSFCVEYQYLKVKPTESISVLGKARHKKNRTVIPTEIRAKISLYLREHNPYMLLATQVLYYCFIRPKEMAMLKIGNINWEQSTIFIPGDISKNRKDAIVTAPKILRDYLILLGINEYPNDYYLFSDQCKPGKDFRDEKQFRDYWNNHLRKDLKLPVQYKFYSIKDTGITDLLRNNVDVISVRDQARHSSIEITNGYTPFDIREHNSEIDKNAKEF